jgi:hypothetical protein
MAARKENDDSPLVQRPAANKLLFKVVEIDLKTPLLDQQDFGGRLEAALEFLVYVGLDFVPRRQIKGTHLEWGIVWGKKLSAGLRNWAIQNQGVPDPRMLNDLQPNLRWQSCGAYGRIVNRSPWVF